MNIAGEPLNSHDAVAPGLPLHPPLHPPQLYAPQPSAPSTPFVSLSVLMAASAPAYVLDADFRFVDANAAWLAMLGLPLDQILGCDPIGFEPQPDQPRSRSQRAQAADGVAHRMSFGPDQTLPTTRHRLLGSAGRTHWLDLSLSNVAAPGQAAQWLGLVQDRSAEVELNTARQERALLMDAANVGAAPDAAAIWDDLVQGQPAEAVAVLTEITRLKRQQAELEERRRARQGLAQQAERTRSVLNSVQVGIVTVSAHGIEWMNRSARRMFAGELSDFHGQPLSLVATEHTDHPLRRTDWLQSLQEDQAQTFECQMRGRDGREFWVVGSAMLSAAGHGVEREATFALLDIERRRQAELSMAQAKGSLQRVIETAPMAIALFDARSLCVQQLNQTAGEFFGKPLLAQPGSSLQEICEPEQAQALQNWMRVVASGQGTLEQEWQVMPLGQEQTPLVPLRVWDCRIATLANDADGISQLLLVASDVTQQREAERARLQAAIDQREVLVREVHHRIKNNLQGVAGLLQQSAAQKPELAGALNEAVSQVQAIAQVHGLQVGGGAPLAMADLLRAIGQSVQRTFGNPVTVDLVGHVPHLLPEAESIPVALTVNELLTNAIKHGRGEMVRCSLVAQGDSVCIRIAGQGQLAPGFDLKRVPSGVSGLGLVRALLPRRSAVLTLRQQGDDVVAEVLLHAPSVRWPATEARPELDQGQLDL